MIDLLGSLKPVFSVVMTRQEKVSFYEKNLKGMQEIESTSDIPCQLVFPPKN